MLSFFRRHSFACLLILAIFITHAYAVFAPVGGIMSWFNSDDAFYYFKTAQNIAEGYGITFDRLGPEGGFHPLWMAMLVPIFALARFDLILPLRLVIVLSGVLNAVTGLLLYRLMRRAVRAEVAALAAFFFCFFPAIHGSVVQLGLESGISAVMLVLLLLVCVEADQSPTPRRLILAGLVGILTVFARLDNVFVVLVMGAWLAFHPGQQGWAAARRLLMCDGAIITLGVLAAYMLRVGFGPVYAGVSFSEYILLVLALALRVGMGYLFGLYAPPQPAGRMRYALRIGLSWAASTALLAVVMIGLSALKAIGGFPRMVLLYEGGFALLALALPRIYFVLRPPAAQRYSKLPLTTFFTRLGAFFTPIGVGLLAYMGFYQAYFGTFMPVSGQIKRWWGTLPNPIYGKPVHDLPGLLGFFEDDSPWHLAKIIFRGPLGDNPAPIAQALTLLWSVVLVVLIVTVVYTQRKRLAQALTPNPSPMQGEGGGKTLTPNPSPAGRGEESSGISALLPFAIGCFLHAISYTGTGYLHVRTWYWTSQLVLITALLALLLDAGVLQGKQWLRAARMPRWANLRNAAMVGGALFVALLVVDLLQDLPYDGSTLADVYYLYGMDRLQEVTEPGTVIGSTGGGSIAYLVRDRTIVNLDGLMNTSEYFHRLQTGTAAEYLDRIGLKYVFTSEYVITSSDPYFQFKGRLQKIEIFGGATLFHWVKE